MEQVIQEVMQVISDTYTVDGVFRPNGVSALENEIKSEIKAVVSETMKSDVSEHGVKPIAIPKATMKSAEKVTESDKKENVAEFDNTVMAKSDDSASESIVEALAQMERKESVEDNTGTVEAANIEQATESTQPVESNVSSALTFMKVQGVETPNSRAEQNEQDKAIVDNTIGTEQVESVIAENTAVEESQVLDTSDNEDTNADVMVVYSDDDSDESLESAVIDNTVENEDTTEDNINTAVDNVIENEDVSVDNEVNKDNAVETNDTEDTTVDNAAESVLADVENFFDDTKGNDKSDVDDVVTKSESSDTEEVFKLVEDKAPMNNIEGTNLEGEYDNMGVNSNLVQSLLADMGISANRLNDMTPEQQAALRTLFDKQEDVFDKRQRRIINKAKENGIDIEPYVNPQMSLEMFVFTGEVVAASVDIAKYKAVTDISVAKFALDMETKNPYNLADDVKAVIVSGILDNKYNLSVVAAFGNGTNKSVELANCLTEFKSVIEYKVFVEILLPMFNGDVVSAMENVGCDLFDMQLYIDAKSRVAKNEYYVVATDKGYKLVSD